MNNKEFSATASCELCLLPLALCTCYLTPSVFSEGSTINTNYTRSSRGQARTSPADSTWFNVGTPEAAPQPVLASPEQSGWPTYPLPLLVAQESDIFNPTGFAGAQPSMMPMNQEINSEAETEQHPRPTVASSRQLSAANRRRKNAVPGRFMCDLCSQNFTSRHNLKNHINSHFRRKPHHCSRGCGSTFGTKSSMNRHRKTCVGKK